MASDGLWDPASLEGRSIEESSIRADLRLFRLPPMLVPLPLLQHLRSLPLVKDPAFTALSVSDSTLKSVSLVLGTSLFCTLALATDPGLPLAIAPSAEPSVPLLLRFLLKPFLLWSPFLSYLQQQFLHQPSEFLLPLGRLLGGLQFPRLPPLGRPPRALLALHLLPLFSLFGALLPPYLFPWPAFRTRLFGLC